VPKHVLLYNAFGWESPIYAHLPLILAPTGQGKLSKRHGGVEIRDFRRQGYLPEAMVNYLARVGWSYDDKTEIFARGELIRYFDLSGVKNSPARFSYERLEWINGYYIRQLNADELAEQLAPFMSEAGRPITSADLRPIVPLIQERLKTLSDVAQAADFFFADEILYDPKVLVGQKMTAAESLAALQRVREILVGSVDLSAEALEPPLRALAEKLGLKPGQLFSIVRVAITGKTVSPPLLESMAVLGWVRTLARLDRAAEILAQAAK
jgi:glutamyl-tRNA synthetase